ncbi:CapA family protein [Staphylococcus epidermidis]|uniref:CapA family protein n=1 Tax=Bacteria TaxID=2 RepID=UPI00119F8416|nr:MULTISPECIES: CapA family protein [Bacteria]KAB2177141.1 CapA family protein [Staphylococcus epidermidis]MBM0863395.1 CapA family protein [Staphylococcus epidermidis]MBM5873980.1 CapA family protein [Staphylococcus epidermidis]MBM5967874.1 CapA family protein [Staphylococcus epidermidis]MBM6084380.1 CapA family protein [Staphylococcus epidermidis]
MKKIIAIIFFSLLAVITIIFAEIDTHFNHEKVSFVAVGDNLIHPVVYNDAKTRHNDYDFSPMYKNVKPYIKKFDIAYINQESPIGGDDIPYSGFKRFNTPSDLSKYLVESGFNLINGSNNHALDKGTHGVNHRVNLWEKYKEKGVMFTGVYKSKKDNEKLQIINKNGIKIAILNYTFGTNGLKPENKYQINYLNENKIKRDVQYAKKHSDAVIVSTHWGQESHHYPNKKQERYAKVFANSNVDAVIGMHPHVIQPVKWVKGKNNHKTLIVYSLGNFLNGQNTGNESNNLCGSINFDITENGQKIVIKNVHWKSLVNFYRERIPGNKDSRYDFTVYPLDKYNDKIANEHGMQSGENKDMTKEHMERITNEIIDKEFLKSN